MKYLHREVGIRDLSYSASEPFSLLGALWKPHNALRGVVPGASGPAAAVFILQTHPNRMDWNDPTAPVVLSSAAQPIIVWAQDSPEEIFNQWKYNLKIQKHSSV